MKQYEQPSIEMVLFGEMDVLTMSITVAMDKGADDLDWELENENL